MFGPSVLLIIVLSAALIDCELITNWQLYDTYIQSVNSERCSSAKSIMDFLKDVEKTFILGPQTEFVLLLGTTGTGKTTIGLIVTTDNSDLESVEIVEHSGKFVIIDHNGRISPPNETISSKTVVPELLIGERNDSSGAFYDCPGFSDTRTVEYDISSTFFLQKLLNYSRAVKLAFVVNHSSMQSGNDRSGFMELVNYAIDLVRDVDKYRRAIVLVVNKVENRYVRDDNDNWHLVSDREEIELIGHFLLDTKSVLVQQNQTAAVHFVDTLLEKKSNNFTRIGIMRQPDRSGPLVNMSVIQTGKRSIIEIIENIQFVSTENADFGYTILPKSLNCIVNLIDEVSNDFVAVMTSISNEIKQIYADRESRSSDISVLIGQFSLAYQLLRGVESDDPRIFLQKTVKMANALGASISLDNLNNATKQIEYYEFLTIFRNNSAPTTLPDGLKDCKKYVEESQTWYRFLDNLNEAFSTYEIQKDVGKYSAHVTKLIRQCSDARNLTNVDETNLKDLLKAMNIQFYRDVEHLIVNAFKLHTLKRLMEETMMNNLSKECTGPDKLTVKGNFIQFTDIFNHTCDFTVKYFDIFAVNKIFIDSDVNETGRDAQMVIIAPHCDIIGPEVRQLLVNGENGKSHDNSKAREGKPGEPGLPGQSGGRVIIIADNYTGDDRFEIHANGGRGGPGQAGGNGAEARNGEDPDFVTKDSSDASLQHSQINDWTNRHGFQVDFIDKYEEDYAFVGYYVYYVYKVHGTPGMKGGDGGDGGASGEGGFGGNIFAIGLHQTPDFKILNKTGDLGLSGSGGAGAEEVKNGDILTAKYIAEYTIHHAFPYFSWHADSSGSNGRIAGGKNGITGHNRANIIEPLPAKFEHPSQSINCYKYFIREHLANSTRESYLRAFLSDLDENKDVQSLYDVLGLVDEFQSLERQYFKLRNDVSYVPYLQSLLTRIANYDLQSERETSAVLEHKKVLSYLYSSILSRICSYKNNANIVLVINLMEYLSLAKGDIRILEKINKQIAIDNHRTKYKEIVTNKIQSANELIATQVTPQIERLFTEIDTDSQRLISEIIEAENDTKKDIAAYERKRKQLEDSLMLRKMLFPLRFVGAALGFFGPLGEAVGAAIDGSTKIAESLIIDDSNAFGNEEIAELTSAFQKASAQIKEEIKRSHALFEVQLIDIEGEVNAFLATNETSAELTDIQRKVEEIRANITTEETSSKTAYDPTVIDKMRDELGDLLNDKIVSLKKQQPSDRGPNYDKVLKILDKAKGVIEIVQLSIDFYNQIKDDQSKVDILNAIIIGLEARLRELQQMEKEVYAVMIPLFRSLESSLDTMAEKMKKQSHVELDLTKWKIGTTLRDVKVQIRQMTDTFSVQDDFMRCFDKLDEGMAVMIDVYDRIDSYQDDARLADYIADTASDTANRIKLTDPELNDAVLYLDKTIRSNLILEEFEMALRAFKQHRFPFASLYESQSELPSQLQLNDTASLVLEATNKIEVFERMWTQSDSVIEEFDNVIYPRHVFSSADRKTGPFFVWKHRQITEELVKLMRGEEIHLKADITKGVNKNAIKFNEIGIQFNFENETSQVDFYSEIENFGISMTLTGNNYYQCNKNFYYIPIEKDIEIAFTITRNGSQTNINNVYDKILRVDPMLSPYAVWTIRLKNDTAPFERLQRFHDEVIDVELIGRGQYLEQGDFLVDICNDNLNKFYNLDRSISTMYNNVV